MARPLNADELVALGRSLATPTALTELAVFAACLGIAWLVARVLRGGNTDRQSVWFGRAIVDGVLFPLLALLAVLAARWALAGVLPIAVFRLVVPLMVALAVIRTAVRALRAAFPDLRLARLVERTGSWLVWGGLVAWVTGLLPVLLDELGQIHWSLGGTTISLRDLLEGAVTAVAVMVLALWLSAAIEARILRDGLGSLSLRKMAANVIRALLIFVGLMFALTAAGIDLTALGVLGGAVGVGIGLGLQKLAANYVSGFVILAENSLRIGDIVTVDGFEGRITDISTRYTVIRALNGRESIVPNEMMITQRVENASLADRNIVLNATLQVAYGTDVEPLMADIERVVAEVPRVLAEPAVAVRLNAFAADGLELSVYFWIGDPENGTGNVRSDVNLALLRLLNARGVEIPFPQRVIRHA